MWGQMQLLFDTVPVVAWGVGVKERVEGFMKK